jgi:hypothetical protein
VDDVMPVAYVAGKQWGANWSHYALWPTLPQTLPVPYSTFPGRSLPRAVGLAVSGQTEAVLAIAAAGKEGETQ